MVLARTNRVQRRHSGCPIYALGILAALFVLASLRSADAVMDAARRCQAAKLEAAGTASGAILRCHSLAALAGRSIDPDCLDGARRAMAAAFAKAELDDCTTMADAPAVEAAIERRVAAIARTVRPTADASQRESRKLACIGEAAASLLKSFASEKKNPTPDASPVTRISAKAARQLRAVDGSSGATASDLGDVWADLYRLTGDVVELLWPIGVSGIRFEHSKTWSLSAAEFVLSSGRSFELNTFGGRYRGGFPVVHDGAIRIYRSPAADLQSFIDRQRLGRQIVERDYFEIAGEKARGVTYRDVHEEEGYTETEYEVFLLHGNSVYVFALNPVEAEYRGALLEILESLRFTD